MSLRRIARGMVVLAALAGGVAHADQEPDEYADHRARGLAALGEQQYRAALNELNAAYQIHSSPDLLHPIGQAYERLGHGKEALAYYRRYLELASPPDAERDKVNGEIRRLNRLTAEAPDPETPPLPARHLRDGERMLPVRFERRIDHSLFFTGLAVALTGYLPALIGGLIEGTHADSLTLLIPVAGPVVSGIVSENASWAAGWILTTGVLQVIGLVMMVAGSRRTHEVPVLVSPTVTSTTATLTLIKQF